MITRRDVLLFTPALILAPAAGMVSYSRPVRILAEPYRTIAVVHRDLFPGSLVVPSPHFLNAIDYLGGVMKDPRIEDEEKVFLENGAKWLNEQAQEDYGKAYYLLDAAQRQNVLETISGETWGDNWLWTLFSYLFEALLCDPVYGANTLESGWHWLEFVPGYPRPKAPFI